MTFPTVTAVTDDFNRANESPVTGGSWQATAWDARPDAEPLDVDTNQLTESNPATGVSSSQHWNGVAGPDVESYCTVADPPSDPSTTEWVRLPVRLQGGGTTGADGYMGNLYSVIGLTRIEIYRVDNGVSTQLGGGSSFSLDAGGSFGVECEGNEIRAYCLESASGWNQIKVAVDATYPAAGTAGIEILNEAGNVRLDDWIYGTKIPQPSTPIANRPRSIPTRKAMI